MNHSDDEKYLRDILSEGEEFLDTNEIWENIEPRLKKKKKRRYIFIWFFLGLGLLGWSGYYLMGHSTQLASNQMENPQDVVSDSNGIQDDSDVSNTKDNIGLDETSSTDASSEAKKDNRTVSKGNGLSLNSGRPSSISKYDVNFYDLKVPSNLGNGAADTKESISYGHSPETDDSPFKAQITEVEKDDEPLDVTPKKDTSASKKVKEKEKQAKKKKKRKGKKKKKSKWKGYAGVEASVGYSRSMLGANDMASEPLVELRKQTDKALETFGAGFEFRYIHQKTGWMLSVGMEYEQFNYVLQYLEETQETITEWGVTSLVLDAGGQTISEEMGLITYTVIRKKNVNIYNQYRFVNIPLGVGYQRTFKRFNMEYEGGLDINLYHIANGKTFLNQEANSLIGLETMSKKVGIRPNIWAKVGMSYPLKERLSLTMSVHAKQRLGSAIQSDVYPLRQTFFSTGVNMGVRVLIK